MTIDIANFTPWASLAGGILLGLAAGALVLLNGRVAGISGIVSGLLQPRNGEFRWRLAFVLGLLVSPVLYALVTPMPAPVFESGGTELVLAGLLVGLGTRYGAGCTSGHGVCGLSRLSIRSLVATLTFMLTAGLTVFVARHMAG